jgi:hypothetical protein
MLFRTFPALIVLDPRSAASCFPGWGSFLKRPAD